MSVRRLEFMAAAAARQEARRALVQQNGIMLAVAAQWSGEAGNALQEFMEALEAAGKRNSPRL